MQKKLAWPLCKDAIQIHEVFHIFNYNSKNLTKNKQIKIIAENFPNLGKDLNIQLHKANRLSYYLKKKVLLKTHYNRTVKKSMIKNLKESQEKRRI